MASRAAPARRLGSGGRVGVLWWVPGARALVPDPHSESRDSMTETEDQDCEPCPNTYRYGQIAESYQERNPHNDAKEQSDGPLSSIF